MTATQVAISPLSPGKWEYERRNHFYFLKSTEYRRLSEAQQHVFLIGHRGTGKTTLLRSLDWGERLANEQLSKLLNHKPFADGNLGCFVGLKLLNLELFESWLVSSNDAVSHIVLGSYFRAVWIEEGVRAVQAVADHYGFTALSAEAEALEVLRDDLENWLPASIRPPRFFGEEDPPLTLASLRHISATLTDRLHGAATIAFQSPEELIEELRLSRIQSLTTRIFHALTTLLEELDSTVPWRFRICMDEGEYLSSLAKQTVRTLVRENESPLFLVIAALSDLGTTTATPGVTITLDDREIVNLDERSLDELASLIDGVVNARLTYQNYPCSFAKKRFIGDPDLNELLLAHPTENLDTIALKEAWADWTRETARSPSPIRSFLESVEIAPSLEGGPAERRRLDSIGYRKYKLAGYFLLLGRMELRRPFFAGWRIFLHMSDNSLRDLLLALDLVRQERFSSETTGPTIAQTCRFLGSDGVSFQSQDRALRALGRLKLDSLPEKVIHYTSNARRLLDFTGRLTHALDFGHYQPKAGPRLDAGKIVVRMPETPVVKDRATITTSTDQGTAGRFVDVLLECAEEGYLKILSLGGGSPEIVFRLHHTLSRYYGCSYRNPQYSTVIPWKDLE